MSADAFPSPGHDHTACRAASIERAREVFEARGLRLTQLRADVFGEIAASHHAIGAYEIIDRLARHGTRLAPISVYRALDVLLDAGVVHRLESRNAYFACHSVDHGQGPQVILACTECGSVAEVTSEELFRAIDDAAKLVKFKPRIPVVEVLGSCDHCSQGDKSGEGKP